MDAGGEGKWWIREMEKVRGEGRKEGSVGRNTDRERMSRWVSE